MPFCTQTHSKYFWPVQETILCFCLPLVTVLSVFPHGLSTFEYRKFRAKSEGCRIRPATIHSIYRRRCSRLHDINTKYPSLLLESVPCLVQRPKNTIGDHPLFQGCVIYVQLRKAISIESAIILEKTYLIRV